MLEKDTNEKDLSFDKNPLEEDEDFFIDRLANLLIEQVCGDVDNNKKSKGYNRDP